MKRLGKILYAAMAATLTILLTVNLLLLGMRVLGHTDHPELFGWSQAVVLTGSMEPAISAGDLILMHREDGYRVGDIITYAEGGASVTHRIVEETEEGYRTQGDANCGWDQEPVAKDRVYGKVAAVIPGVGKIALFFRGNRGRLLLVIFAAGLIWGKDLMALFMKAGRNTSE